MSLRNYIVFSRRDYEDGSLFAWEDRADHEISNAVNGEERIAVTIATMHPDLDVMGEEYSSAQQGKRSHTGGISPVESSSQFD